MEKIKKPSLSYTLLVKLFSISAFRKILSLIVLTVSFLAMFFVDKYNYIRINHFGKIDSNAIMEFMRNVGIKPYDITSNSWIIVGSVFIAGFVFLLGSLFTRSAVKSMSGSDSGKHKGFTALYYGILAVISAAIIAIAVFATGMYKYYNSSAKAMAKDLFLMIAMCICLAAAVLIAVFVLYTLIAVIVYVVKYVVYRCRLPKTQPHFTCTPLSSVLTKSPVILFILSLAMIFTVITMLIMDTSNRMLKFYFSSLHTDKYLNLIERFGIERCDITLTGWIIAVGLLVLLIVAFLATIVIPVYTELGVKKNGGKFTSEKKAKTTYCIIGIAVVLVLLGLLLGLFAFVNGFNYIKGKDIGPAIGKILLVYIVNLCVLLVALLIAYLVVEFIAFLIHTIIYKCASGKPVEEKAEEPVSEETVEEADEGPVAEETVEEAVEESATEENAVVEPEPEPEITYAEMNAITPEMQAAMANVPVTTSKDKVRIEKSFQGKMCQASQFNRNSYSDLKNYLLSYKKVSSRLSWTFESFNLGRSQKAKIALRGQTLLLHLALDPNDYADSKYFLTSSGPGKKYAEVPAVMKIKSARALKHAFELIDIVMKDTEKKKNYKEERYCFVKMSNQKLIETGLAKYVSSRF